MRLVFAILAGAIVAAPAYAADTDIHAFPLRIGDHGVIEVRAVETTVDPKDGTNRRSEDIDLEYKARGDGYRVTATSWRYLDHLDVDGKPRMVLTEVDDLNLRRAFYPITYAADAQLQPLRAENLDQVKARVDAAIDEIVKYRTYHIGEATAKAGGDKAKAAFHEMTPESVVRLIGNIYMGTAYTYPPMVLNQPVSTRVVNDLGSEDPDLRVNIDEVTTLTAWNPSADTAHLVYDRTMIPAYVTPDMLAAWKARPRRDHDDVWVIHRHCDIDITVSTGLVSKSACRTDDGRKPEPGQEVSSTTVFTLTLKR
jgi:hypothetical protein